jgi:hypothetical protein
MRQRCVEDREVETPDLQRRRGQRGIGERRDPRMAAGGGLARRRRERRVQRIEPTADVGVGAQLFPPL